MGDKEEGRDLLDQLTSGQLDWAPMDDEFDAVSLSLSLIVCCCRRLTPFLALARLKQQPGSSAGLHETSFK